ncbi:LysE family transporter [Nitrososphaera sp.]|uniref:LysE family transporter n=1 Tax=Nitrososphaera sp. TaxID=1971748 RepID=UPI002ED972BB
MGEAAVPGFAGLQVYSVLKNGKQAPIAQNKSPFAIGIVLTALNPFFLVWWLTVGLKLVADLSRFGPVAGVAFMFGMHVWMDYAWLSAVA